MSHLPLYITVTFISTTLLTLFFFAKACKDPKVPVIMLVAWLTLQSAVSLTGFYTNTEVIPPRFALLIVPPLILIAVLFLTSKGRLFLDSLSIKYLILLISYGYLSKLDYTVYTSMKNCLR